MDSLDDFNIILAIHTGVHSDFNEEKILRKLRVAKRCIHSTFERFREKIENESGSGALAVDLVESAVSFLESSGMTNSGIGSIPQKDGVQRMDASIMRGYDLEYGAVGSLRGFANPISVARLIMERKDGHNMYAHDFAAKLAENAGLSRLPKENNKRLNDDVIGDPSEHGTVGAVACISDENAPYLCAGTSTGGFGSCEPGRIGDSCIIGAGTYANKFIASSCTGHGESIVKMAVSKRLSDKYIDSSPKDPQEIVDDVINEFAGLFPERRDSLGVIALDRKCHLAVGIKGAAMVWAALGIPKDSHSKNPNYFIIYGSGIDDIKIERID